MEEPTTKPRGSKPASPSSTYSDTERSEVNTPDGVAPAVLARRLSAAGGSHADPSWFVGGAMGGIANSSLHGVAGITIRAGPGACGAWRRRGKARRQVEHDARGDQERPGGVAPAGSADLGGS